MPSLQPGTGKSTTDCIYVITVSSEFIYIFAAYSRKRTQSEHAQPLTMVLLIALFIDIFTKHNIFKGNSPRLSLASTFVQLGAVVMVILVKAGT